jgi:hypothetical protein
VRGRPGPEGLRCLIRGAPNPSPLRSTCFRSGCTDGLTLQARRRGRGRDLIELPQLDPRAVPVRYPRFPDGTCRHPVQACRAQARAAARPGSAATERVVPVIAGRVGSSPIGPLKSRWPVFGGMTPVSGGRRRRRGQIDGEFPRGLVVSCSSGVPRPVGAVSCSVSAAFSATAALNSSSLEGKLWYGSGLEAPAAAGTWRIEISS